MRADVSFKDVQELASGNYLCLCVFETCIHTLHHFKQSKCGCMSALLILILKITYLFTCRRDTDAKPRESVWSFPLQSVPWHAYIRVCARERNLVRKCLKSSGAAALTGELSSALWPHIQDKDTASAAHFNTASPHLSQAESPVSHSLVMYCEVHRPRALWAVGHN